MLKNIFLDATFSKLDVKERMRLSWDSLNFKLNFKTRTLDERTEVGNLFSAPNIGNITILEVLDTRTNPDIAFQDMMMCASYLNSLSLSAQANEVPVFVPNDLVELMYSEFNIGNNLKKHIAQTCILSTLQA